MSEWGDKTVDNKTEWSKRDGYLGSSSSLGVQDNRFHLGDDKKFTFGYDSDFSIRYKSGDDVLAIASADNIGGYTPEIIMKKDGSVGLPIHTELPTVSGAAMISFLNVASGSSVFPQMHIGVGTSNWTKVICDKDVVNTADFSGNNGDTYDVPTVKAVKDFVNTSGVANTFSGATDTNISAPGTGNLAIYDTTDSKWHNREIIGDIAITNLGASAVNINAVSYAKMQDTTASDVVLGRQTAGGGNIEEIACTSIGRAILAASTLNSFPWHKYGAFNITKNWRYINNIDDTWYALRDTYSSEQPDIQTATFDPDTSTFKLKTEELARSLCWVAPKSGKIQNIIINVCSTSAILKFSYAIMKFDADVNDTTGDASNLLVGSAVLNSQFTSLAADKYMTDYVDGVNVDVAQGDGIVIAVRTTNSTVKPDMSASFSISGNFT
jgi:hypothetical protein